MKNSTMQTTIVRAVVVGNAVRPADSYHRALETRDRGTVALTHDRNLDSSGNRSGLGHHLDNASDEAVVCAAAEGFATAGASEQTR
jgi:hypothetical protein